jgi:hypothetical protein
MQRSGDEFNRSPEPGVHIKPRWPPFWQKPCPHPYFNDNRQLTIRLILMIIICLEATKLKLNFDMICEFTTIIEQLAISQSNRGLGLVDVWRDVWRDNKL